MSQLIMKRTTASERIKNCTIYAILIGTSFLLLFPMLYMLSNSFMDSREVTRTYAALMGGDTGNVSIQSIGFKFIPDQVSFMQYYNVLLRKPKFLVLFWNSVIITVPIMLGQIIVSSFAAYAFSKLQPLQVCCMFQSLLYMCRRSIFHRTTSLTWDFIQT